MTNHVVGMFTYVKPEFNYVTRFVGGNSLGPVAPLADDSERLPTKVYDGRSVARRQSLDAEGFRLIQHRSLVNDFYDLNEVERVYSDELIALVRNLTGCENAFLFDYQTRYSGAPVGKPAPTRHYRIRDKPTPDPIPYHTADPVLFAHTDYAADSGDTLLASDVRSGRGAFKGVPVEQFAGRRYAIYKVWRPMTPVRQFPLAMCDDQTISEADRVLCRTEFPPPEVYKDSYFLKFNPQQRWYYFPEMDRDEALVFKTFDSNQSVTWSVFHSAFAAPALEADPPPRQSCESTLVVFY